MGLIFEPKIESEQCVVFGGLSIFEPRHLLLPGCYFSACLRWEVGIEDAHYNQNEYAHHLPRHHPRKNERACPIIARTLVIFGNFSFNACACKATCEGRWMVMEQTPAVTATEWSSSNVILTPLHRVGQHQHKIQSSQRVGIENKCCMQHVWPYCKRLPTNCWQ